MATLDISGEQRNHYLQQLHSLLELAEQIRLEDHGLLSRIKNMAMILREGEGRYPTLTLSAPPTGFSSGFPHFSVVNRIIADRDTAETFLQTLPPLATSIERCLDLLHDSNPNFRNVQEQVQKTLHFQTLRELSLPALTEERLVDMENVRSFQGYTVVSSAYNLAKMCYLQYTIGLFQDGNSTLIGGSKNGEKEITTEFSSLIRQQQGNASAEMFTALNALRGSAVVSVDRWRIGPVYTLLVNNYDNSLVHSDQHIVNELLQKAQRNGEQFPAVLEIEQQTTEDSDTYLQRDLKAALSRDYKREFVPPIVYRRHFVCSSEGIFQNLERRFLSDKYLAKFYCARSPNKPEVEPEVEPEVKAEVEVE